MVSSVRVATYLLALMFALTGAAPALARTELDERFASPSLRGPGHARIVLPAGYRIGSRRYPVVYFLHGLPAGSSAYRGNEWLADALERVGPAILVFAQGARDGDSDAEYLNWGAGRGWETFVGEELPHWVDSHFRTIADRSGRAIVGLSAGGYGATIIGLHNLGRFSVIESWSGYFHPTDPTGTKPVVRGPLASARNLIPKLRRDEARLPTFFAFYVGCGDLRFRLENLQLNGELRSAHVEHAFAVYPGAHTTSLWQTHAVVWLRMALSHLAAPHR
jgi:S-formylglutathione hydrolase FrmB